MEDLVSVQRRLEVARHVHGRQHVDVRALMFETARALERRIDDLEYGIAVPRRLAEHGDLGRDSLLELVPHLESCDAADGTGRVRRETHPSSRDLCTVH